MGKKLEGKVAVVTGASKGIGAQIASRFAAEGARVVVNYVNSREAAEARVAEIGDAGGHAAAVQADVRKKGDVERLFAVTLSTFGATDILVNNAGIYRFVALNAIDENHFREHVDLNMLSIIYTSQQAALHFANRGGNIINISSIVGHTPAPGALVYSATKAAVLSMTRGLAIELRGKARVNAIAPGLVETEGLNDLQLDSRVKDYMVSHSLMKRLGTPDDVASAALFLASEESSWVTGETFIVAGGCRL